MLKGGDFLSKQNKDVKSNSKHQSNTTSNQIKQQLNEFTNSSKRRLQALNLKNRLKIDRFKTKISESKVDSLSYTTPLQTQIKPHDLRMLNRFTTIFSGVVITGLSVGLLLMSRPMITEANFETKMQESIDSAFHYSVMESNTKNDSITYHTPRQFKYLYSLGVNDIIKYKDNEIIMHYNNQYNIIGQDMDTYYLLRDENKSAGQEVFYKNFSNGEQNGFVQLVKMEEKYLLTVFVDGTKLSALVDYEETPYMTYNMLVVAKTVKSTQPETSTATVATGTNQVIPETSEAADAKSSTLLEVPAMSMDESGHVETNMEPVTDGELSTVESEHVIDFDFSTEKRGEFTETTQDSTQNSVATEEGNTSDGN